MVMTDAIIFPLFLISQAKKQRLELGVRRVPECWIWLHLLETLGRKERQASLARLTAVPSTFFRHLLFNFLHFKFYLKPCELYILV